MKLLKRIDSLKKGKRETFNFTWCHYATVSKTWSRLSLTTLLCEVPINGIGNNIVICVCRHLQYSLYSRVHISSDTAYLKILKKPSIVQE